MDKVEKFKLLAKSATVDGDIGKDEYSLLEIYAERLKISAEQCKSILDDLSAGQTVEIKTPADPEQRLELLKAIVKIIAADNQITNQELLYFQKVARHFKVDYDQATHFLREAMH
ncbi:MAG: TerB family tellurite resistance protein [Planctomycetota bacterium]|nr:TerB family tellurite resistance protein [Planctomycetota bacterium]